MSTEQVATAKLIEAITELVKVRVREEMKSLPSGQLGPREIMLAKGFTISDVAARSGLSDVSVGKILRGQTKNPKPETLNKIARALQVSEADFRAAVAAMLQRTVA
ncbi:MAG TPA: helix-turn-helix transcriptional regulator [Planctomycetota bacterium]|nr:helix-turn-helix transcriptional regulator [Planctomycetota bacterium]